MVAHGPPGRSLDAGAPVPQPRPCPSAQTRTGFATRTSTSPSLPADRSTAGHYEFTTEEVADLLDELDRRLRQRGVAASIFVVGGAAIAATGVRGGRLTDDVDALAPSLWSSTRPRRWPANVVCRRPG